MKSRGTPYILEGKRPVRCDHFKIWAERTEQGRESGSYCVAADTIGEARITTIFLGEDCQWGEGPPLLFETYVSGGSLDDRMERYSTWAQAETGHKLMAQRVRKAM